MAETTTTKKINLYQLGQEMGFPELRLSGDGSAVTSKTVWSSATQAALDAAVAAHTYNGSIVQPVPVPPMTVLEFEFGGANVAPGGLPLTSPMSYPFHSGTFVAPDRPVIVDISVSAACVGMAWAPLDFYCGPANIGQLTPTSQGAALASGVVRKRCGAIMATTIGPSRGHARFVLADLVPGTTYRWELSAAITGVLTVETVGTTANKIGCSTASDGDGYFRAVCRNDGSNNATVMKVAGLGVLVDPVASKTWATIALPAVATTGQVAVTPDGTKAVVTNTADHSVSIITMPANGTTAPSVVRVVVPGTTPSPTGVTITPDGLTAYIGRQGLNDIIPMDISNGNFGTAVGLGAAHPITGVEVSPNVTVKKIVVATNDGYAAVFSYTGAGATGSTTLDGLVANPSGTGFFHTDCIGISPDGVTAYIASGPAFGFIPLTIATRAFGTAVNTGVNCTSVRVLPDGLSLLALSTTNNGRQVQHYNLTTSSPVRYVEWGFLAPDTAVAAGGIALSGRGDILVTAKAGGRLYDWTGAWLQVRQAPFNAEVCRVLLERSAI